MAKKKTSKHLVPIGTHVPTEVKMTIIALAESQDMSVYELLQEKITEMAEAYDKELNSLREKTPPPAPLEDRGNDGIIDNGEDLLA